MRCHEDCDFYIKSLDTCMFCNYHHQGGIKCLEQEKEEFDILNFDKEESFCSEWWMKKIQKRLMNHGVNCHYVDMWGCDEIAYILGLWSPDFRDVVSHVARVLNLHEDVIYYDSEHGFMILNLFQEKILRRWEETIAKRDD